MAKTLAIGSRPVVNVMDYGAVADDQTDNRLAFKDAITAAIALGPSIVYVPAGTYLFTTMDTAHGIPGDPTAHNSDIGGAIELQDWIWLRGAGQGATTLRYTYVGQSCVIASWNSHVQVSDMEVYLSAGGSGDCIKLYSCDDVHVWNVTVHGGQTGVALLGCTNSECHDSLSYDHSNAGFAGGCCVMDYTSPIGEYANHITFTDCEAYDCHNGSFRAYGRVINVPPPTLMRHVDNVHFVRCHTHDCDVEWARGIWFTGAQNCSATDCITSASKVHNVAISGGHNITITNNDYTNPGYLVARVLHATNNTSPFYTGTDEYAIYGDSSNIVEDGETVI